MSFSLDDETTVTYYDQDAKVIYLHDARDRAARLKHIILSRTWAVSLLPVGAA